MISELLEKTGVELNQDTIVSIRGDAFILLKIKQFAEREGFGQISFSGAISHDVCLVISDIDVSFVRKVYACEHCSEIIQVNPLDMLVILDKLSGGE